MNFLDVPRIPGSPVSQSLRKIHSHLRRSLAARFRSFHFPLSTSHFSQPEPLEARIAPAALVAHWIGGSGHWSDPAHWDIGVVPSNGGGNTYSVVIDLPGSAPAVTLDAAISIHGLTHSEVLHLTAGASTLSGSLVNTGRIDHTGSASLDLTGTFTAPAFGSLAANGGTVKISGTLDLAQRRDTERTVGCPTESAGGAAEISRWRQPPDSRKKESESWQ